MKFPVRPELPTASVGSSQAPTAAVDNSAPCAIRPESTYKSGKVVQTNGATSLAITYDRVHCWVRRPIAEQTERIDQTDGAGLRVCECVQAPSKPNRITLHIPADTWIVIPEVVVSEVRLSVVVLPRESQREVERGTRIARIVIGHIIAERLLLIPPPHRRTGSVGNEPWCVQI